MSDATVDSDGAADAPPGKSRKLPLLIGVVLALLGGGGGYFAVSSGMIGSVAPGAEEPLEVAPETSHDIPAMHEGRDGLEVHFVRMPQLLVSLGPNATARHLRFTAAIETVAGAEEAIAQLEPRILDVMNGYLQALEPADIEAPGGLLLLSGQLTRRLQLVLGEDRMRDLLVLEFVLN